MANTPCKFYDIFMTTIILVQYDCHNFAVKAFTFSILLHSYYMFILVYYENNIDIILCIGLHDRFLLVTYGSASQHWVVVHHPQSASWGLVIRVILAPWKCPLLEFLHVIWNCWCLKIGHQEGLPNDSCYWNHKVIHSLGLLQFYSITPPPHNQTWSRKRSAVVRHCITAMAHTSAVSKAGNQRQGHVIL